ncbi:hypothetical protein [Edaphobacillus lindanitolerans]|uniref:Uncharacterized protein n=1 Tax=Edaphobacillus lindanitolerans TaxID=550447 RepID=A0A1U7PJN3_9BACI|nr:hypothetical protein [Edaphobacillus lindanitolerans]SIT69359.1 hypothetical protein SAMN05428946_0479 [Edaphobacillus lindanitolerans]
MARYEIIIKNPTVTRENRNWRLIRRDSGDGRIQVIQEGDAPVGTVPYMLFGPILLTDVEIDLRKGSIVFEKHPAYREGFRILGPRLMSSYVLEYGENRFGFFLNGKDGNGKRGRQKE